MEIGVIITSTYYLGIAILAIIFKKKTIPFAHPDTFLLLFASTYRFNVSIKVKYKSRKRY